MMKNSAKNALIISIVLTVIIVIYIILICCLRNYYITTIPKNDSFKNNEFGDFIGGLLNPLFTLLSTVSIIFLTYIVAKGEGRKAEKSITTQKRITLSQMRQTSFESLIQKTNLYVYEIDNLSIHTAKNKFHQSVLTNLIKSESNDQKRVTVWLVILSELENFIHLEYLFSDLFQKEEFKEKYKAIIDVTSKLSEEQGKMMFIDSKTFEKYIACQQEFLTTIGNYIYSEF